MIVYPKDWKKDYSDFAEPNINVQKIISILKLVLYDVDVPHLAYSGGIDSTIMLALMKQIYGEAQHKIIHTYTISSRETHPDVLFARQGSEKYNTKHHEFIVKPTEAETDKFLGDNAVRQFFENVDKYTNKIICCDGIDEFMCGYYEHRDMKVRTYEFYLGRLTFAHLTPLSEISKDVKVYLPYLDRQLIDEYRNIPLSAKVDYSNRKKIMVKIANYLEIPESFTNRNKYGFCDAFREEDK